MNLKGSVDAGKVCGDNPKIAVFFKKLVWARKQPLCQRDKDIKENIHLAP